MAFVTNGNEILIWHFLYPLTFHFKNGGLPVHGGCLSKHIPSNFELGNVPVLCIVRGLI